MKSGLFWRWNLFCEPVFQPEAGDTGEMPGIAAYKAKVVGNGNGSNFEIRQGKRSTCLFQVGPETAADISRLCIKANDIDRRQKNILQVPEVEIRPVAFTGAVDDFRDGNSTYELLPLR